MVEKQRGFIVAHSKCTAKEIGDEPMQYFQKFGGKATVAVGEKRVYAIKQLLNKETYDLFLLDDAFQHRALKASFYILLTDYKRLFTDDYLMPLGLLRESRKGASRADVIIVSKCPYSLAESEQSVIIEKIRKYSKAPVFFTKMVSSEAIEYKTKSELPLNSKVVTLSAIAQNDLFVDEVKQKHEVVKRFSFNDHHHFTHEELAEIMRYTTEYNLSVCNYRKRFYAFVSP